MLTRLLSLAGRLGLQLIWQAGSLVVRISHVISADLVEGTAPSLSRDPRNLRSSSSRRTLQTSDISRSACLRRSTRASRLLLLVGAAFWLALPALAQEAAAPAVPTVNDLKAAAFDAQSKASQARALADQAEKAAQAAEQRLTEAKSAAAAAAAAAASGAAVGSESSAAAQVPPQVLEDLHRATEEAKNAAASARAANAALAEYMQERADRYSRRGFYLMGGIFYAPQLFDTSYSAANSQGAFGAIGYHFAKRFEVEARFDGFQKFDLTGSSRTATFEGFTVTANVKIFLLTRSFQPYLGLGIGALDGKVVETEGGSVDRHRYTVGLFRVSGGFDWYLTETIAITGDAAVNLPGGALSNANYATLGGGLKLRF